MRKIKNLLLLAILVFSCPPVKSQYVPSDYVDSLRRQTAPGMDNKERMKSFLQLGRVNIDINNDSSMIFAQQAYLISLQLKSSVFEEQCLDLLGIASLNRGNSDQALRYLLNGFKLAESIKDTAFLIEIGKNIGAVYKSQHDYLRAAEYYANALKIVPGTEMDSLYYSWALAGMGDLLWRQHKPDSALYYSTKSFEWSERIHLLPSDKYKPLALNIIGNVYQQSGNYTEALKKYRQAAQTAFANYNLQYTSDNFMSMARLYRLTHQVDSGFYYAQKAFNLDKQVNNPQAIESSSGFLKDYFRDKKLWDSAFVYQEIMSRAKDSLLNLEKIRQVQDISFNEQIKKEEIKTQLLAYRNNIKMYGLLAGLLVLLAIALLLFRNNRQEQKAKLKIEHAYADLKSAQAQLVQAEKMASLGELTAGIAHEIQNPLNFVNNFSEVNTELIDEMEREISKGNLDEAKAIAKDIKANEQKISHHGKRADGIVKGMLQHSQSSTGTKVPTDINALADEYLRLAYHGLRAKDKSFNATMKTDFDPKIGHFHIVSQDIGRVLLNLYSNAFYAVSEKEKQQIVGYSPTVTVSTNRTDGKVQITVKDNGNGIAEKIQDKIFQPFFTTKPTGHGTGLGLSMSYDIVKAHGGELKMTSKQGEGAEFVVMLPAI